MLAAALCYVADSCLPSPWGLLSPQELQRQLDATSTQVARHRATWLARPPRRNRSRVRQSEHSCACLGRMKITSARRWSCEQLHLESSSSSSSSSREGAQEQLRLESRPASSPAVGRFTDFECLSFSHKIAIATDRMPVPAVGLECSFLIQRAALCQLEAARTRIRPASGRLFRDYYSSRCAAVQLTH